jgi:predicted ATP-dependent protease
VEPRALGFTTTRDLEPLLGVHAQSRALEAIHLGTDLYGPGYNIFCLGLTSTDRVETVKTALAQLQTRCTPAPDRCYVMRFRQPDAPRLLELPRGTVARFRRDLDDLVESLVKHLGLVFEEDRFAQRLRQINEHHQRKEREILGKLHDLARENGFAVAQVEGEEGARIDLLYRVQQQLVSMEELETAAKDAKAGVPPRFAETLEDGEALIPLLARLDLRRIRSAYGNLSAMLARSMVESRHLARSLHLQVQALEREESLVVVEGAVQELASRYQASRDVRAHVEEMKADVLEHLALFKRTVRTPPAEAGREAEGEEDSALPPGWADPHARYRAHVVLDNATRSECPVVVEMHPTPRNLFGSIVRVTDRLGRGLADHRSVMPGSLLAADGGYLVLDAAEVLVEPDTWRALKRVLLTGRLDLREAGLERGQTTGPLLSPDPIPVGVKVVMVGDEGTYDYLDSMDPDFRQVFKVRAEFDWLMDRSVDNVRKLGAHVQAVAQREQLGSFTASAVAALAEHAGRLAEQGGKMISRFDLLGDVARQAAFVAREAGDPNVQAVHVRRALAAADRRCSLGAERLAEAIHERRSIINTTGRRVGEINGLAVRSTLDHSFGYPVRITAVVSFGETGVINIEREVKLSGNIHDKGMLIVEGYLRERYGKQLDLGFSASIAFEQSYAEIDGDSASSTEVYALLSAFSGIPLEQGVAVTGSVNQVGEIQPIGSVNEKIEGFHDACVGLAGGTDRLPGHQGVIIPRSNVSDLMLRHDVVAACASGRFHVWAIDTVEQGIELLTGVAAGTADAHGAYAPGTVHHAVLRRLTELSTSDTRHHERPREPRPAAAPEPAEALRRRLRDRRR